MQAEAHLREGRLQDALAELQAQIRKQPANPQHRIFLFQLHCLSSDWQKALTQLNVLRDMDASTIPMAQTYQEAIQCEAIRAEVFAGTRSPLVFGDPERWIALMIESLRPSAQGDYAKASELLSEAMELAPATSGTITSGTIDDTEFEWIADADPRLGPLLEAIVNGRYYWIPFHRIGKIEFEQPSDLRDLVWLPAEFTWANGGQTVGLVPSRYPGSGQHDDNAIRLARKTDWQAVTDQLQYGIGQRLLATDADDYPLLDTRVLTLNVVDDTVDENSDQSQDTTDG